VKDDLLRLIVEITRPTKGYWVKDNLEDEDMWWMAQDSDEHYQSEQLDRMEK
jgi:hypothetical protein